jgi:hypothetical protein
MIKNFTQYNEAAKMSSLKMPSDQEIEEAEAFLEKGVDPDWDKKLGYFYIDVSGKYSVYYTFWRFNPTSHTNMCHYICNLSTDFQTAIEKAKKASGRIPIIIDKFGTQAGLFQAAKAEIITFGKHRGKTLGEVFVEDPQYIKYLYDTYGKYKSTLPYDKLKYYTDLYFETIRKKNLEESTSEYVGKPGDKISIIAKIYHIATKDNPYTGGLQYTCKLIDDDGNKYTTYDIGQKIEQGKTVSLNAKIKAHIELLGVKFTQLFYCKVTGIVEDSMDKYNL